MRWRSRNLRTSWHLVAVSIVSFGPLASRNGSAGEAIAVSLVSDATPGPAATHGLKKILEALESRRVAAERVSGLPAAKGSIRIVAGLAVGSGPAARLLRDARIDVPRAAEALAIHRASVNGKPTLIVGGSDDRGLMYAALDVAERILRAADPGDPISEVRDVVERPDVAERSLSMYTMHRSRFESYFHDEEYWTRYLDLLARSRFNTFALLFGYENAGYFAPPYPYFFDVEGFPDVRVVGITPEQQERNLGSLNRIIEMTHERGLNFTLGIWDHIYRGGVQGPKAFAEKPTPGLVWGLTAERLVPYTKVALARFLREVRSIDAIQFRMHGESGLKRGEMHKFWENIYRVVKASGNGIRFDARAKNFPDSLIDRALEMGIDMRICTKYWMEQMGLPFHPTHIHPRNQFDRRHGYADLLRYPQRYKMHWRLWNGGTQRVLLWGDPEYVRRFVGSTHLYSGEGYEVNEPLATKMQDHPHDMEPFALLEPQYRYYRWEFERYWHFYQLWGRLGYNPDSSDEIWKHEFRRRFGKEAAPHVERGIHRASRILPRIVAYCYPYRRFPMTRGWVEKQRLEDLPVYAKALPSDTQQFLGPDEAARLLLEGKDSPRISPWQSSLWFARSAREVLEQVEEAERRIGAHRNKEFVSTVTDLRILAYLAQYHSRRALAGVSWALFTRTNDLNRLDDAILQERRAVEAWESLVESAGDVYSPDLMMGRRRSGLSGHWRDELVELKKGLKELQRRRDGFQPKRADKGPLIAHVPVRRARSGEDIVVRATVSGTEPITRVRVGYLKKGGAVRHETLQPNGAFLFRAAISGSEVTEDLAYFIEAFDRAGRRSRWPSSGEANGVDSVDSVTVTVTSDDRAPVLLDEPVTVWPASTPLKITATVRDPSGIRWVRLRYRSVNQHQDYRALEMLPGGGVDRYQATVPPGEIDPRWDFMYFFEVMDRRGNGKIHPDLERETPYVVVRLRRLQKK